MMLTFSRLTRQNDVSIGTVASGRIRKDFKNIIGMFVNTFPIRNSIDERLSVKDYIIQTHSVVREHLKNSDVQFDDIMSECGYSDEKQMFQAVLRYQKSYKDYLKIEKLICETEEVLPENNPFELQFFIDEYDDHFELIVSADSKLYHKQFIERMIIIFNCAISRFCEDLDKCLHDTELYSKEEKETILNTFNDTFEFNNESFENIRETRQ